VAGASTDDVYAAMDWLEHRQPAIEPELAPRHLAPEPNPAKMALYDLSSSWLEGTRCPLAARGYSRDGRKGKLLAATNSFAQLRSISPIGVYRNSSTNSNRRGTLYPESSFPNAAIHDVPRGDASELAHRGFEVRMVEPNGLENRKRREHLATLSGIQSTAWPGHLVGHPAEDIAAQSCIRSEGAALQIAAPVQVGCHHLDEGTVPAYRGELLRERIAGRTRRQAGRQFGRLGTSEVARLQLRRTARCLVNPPNLGIEFSRRVASAANPATGHRRGKGGRDRPRRAGYGA
jgi:hypothetical protein